MIGVLGLLSATMWLGVGLTSGSAEWTAEKEIRRLSDDWVSALNRKDLDGLLSMIDEDCVFIGPGQPPIKGKAAARAMYEKLFASSSSIQQTVSIEEIQVVDDWAYSWGNETLTFSLPNGTHLTFTGVGFAIMRRGSDGRWRFTRGINNDTLKPQ